VKICGVAECVILIGLPGSGKSSFYRQHFADTHDHVSRDAMRNNRRPQRREDRVLAEALAAGRSVVVDNTNPDVAIRAALIAAARRHGADVIGYVFPTEARDALRRNRGRSGRDRVPDVAIFTTRKRLELPSYAEGFDQLFIVTMIESSNSFVVTSVTR
jgi:predicted kinase